MNDAFKIVSVNHKNIGEHPQAICFINPKHPSFPDKVNWLKDREKEGFTIKLLYPEGEKKAAAFIEYTRGENAWRAVNAVDYLFIHCIWVYRNELKNKGYASSLITDCLQDAGEQNLAGVAVMTSTGPFMAKRDLFLKNGFVSAARSGPLHELLVNNLKDRPLPSFRNWEEKLNGCKGFQIHYTRQCPWVSRTIEEYRQAAEASGVSLKVIELKTPGEAQSAPSPYATFSLVYNGKLLVDHYISATRFKNILEKL